MKLPLKSIPKVAISKVLPKKKYILVVPLSDKKVLIKDHKKYLKNIDLDQLSDATTSKFDSKKSLLFINLAKKSELYDTDIKKLGYKISSLVNDVEDIVIDNLEELIAFLSDIAIKPEDHQRGSLGELTDSQIHARVIELLLYGVYFGAYDFDYYLKKKVVRFKTLSFISANNNLNIKKAIKKMHNYATALWFERDFVNLSPSLTSPTWCTKTVKDFLVKAGFKVQILNESALKQKKYEGIIAVGKGSSQPPSYLIAKYKAPKSTKNTKHVVLIGKGITFDTGGVNVKPDGGKNMKGDMSGAATAIATGANVALNKENINLTLFIPFAENHINGSAYRPDDIIQYRNGVSVEVHNTDAEGRMILADALIDGSKEKPDLMVDMATLTGASVVAVGREANSFYTNSKDIADKVKNASTESTENSVELPLIKSYNSLLKTDHADIKHIGGRYAGSITAALYLQHFVADGVPWVHFDLSSAFNESGHGIYKAGASGEGILLVSDLIKG